MLHTLFAPKATTTQSTEEYCAFFDKNKHAEYDFLSNWHEHTINTPHGTFKNADELFKKLIANGVTDNIAAMRETLRWKFTDETLKRRLLATKSAYLVMNSPNGYDRLWSDNGNGKGQNILGKLLMELRQQLGGQGVTARPALLEKFYASKCDHCTNCCHFSNKGVVFNYCEPHIPRELKLGKVSVPIKLSDLPAGAGRFLYFKTNDLPELVNEGAELIANRIKELGLKNPYFVTPEASTFALAHELRSKYHIDGAVITKSKKPSDVETSSIEYCAVTSTEKKKLYIDKSQVDAMRGKDIIILDSICTTGETLRATYNLLLKAGVSCNNIAEAIVLFTEGKDMTNVNIAEGVDLKIHRFSNMPLFPYDPSVDTTHYRMYSQAQIPTAHHGVNTVAVFQDKSGNSDKDVVVSYPTHTFAQGRDDIIVRIQDSCAACGLLDGAMCNCKQELEQAQDYIAKHGGIIIQLNQDSRGLSLGNRLLAWNKQQIEGIDSVQANRMLGFPDDVRRYDAVKDVLKALDVSSIRLMTNNPHKVAALQKAGVKITETLSCNINIHLIANDKQK